MSDHPNVLFIVTDQQRLDTLACFGNHDIQTPHLDALADESARFDECYCPYPICVPSRASMLTGLYVHQHGVPQYNTIDDALETFPRILSRAGYRTHTVGKMHLRPTYRDVGFTRMELAEQHGDGRFDDDYHREMREAGYVDAIDLIDQRPEFRERAPDEYWRTCGAMPSNLPDQWHSTTWIGDRGIKALEQWRDRNECLMVSFIKPHHPFDPPASWANMYDPDKLTLPPGWTDTVPAHDFAFQQGYFPNDKLTEPVLRQAMAYYYASISHIDDHVGRLIETLKTRGLYDDTLIIFTSDHGDYLGHHHQLLKSGYPYEPLAKVPLLLRFPGGRDAGERHDFANLVDLAPTILAHCGCDTPETMAGYDLAVPTPRQYNFCQYRRDQYMVRSRTHKLYLAPPESRSMFYDLQADPNELDNRIDDPGEAERIEQHRRAIGDWLMFEAPVVPRINDDAPQLDAPNVPPPDGQRRAEMQQWFFDKARPFFATER